MKGLDTADVVQYHKREYLQKTLSSNHFTHWLWLFFWTYCGLYRLLFIHLVYMIINRYLIVPFTDIGPTAVLKAVNLYFFVAITLLWFSLAHLSNPNLLFIMLVYIGQLIRLVFFFSFSPRGETKFAIGWILLIFFFCIQLFVFPISSLQIYHVSDTGLTWTSVFMIITHLKRMLEVFSLYQEIRNAQMNQLFLENELLKYKYEKGNNNWDSQNT
jgi:hypothetical protein